MEQAINGQVISSQNTVQQQPATGMSSQAVGKSYQLTDEERSVFLEQAQAIAQIQAQQTNVQALQSMQRGALALLARQHGIMNARLSEDFRTMVEAQGG